jgi:hypothetical protein
MSNIYVTEGRPFKDNRRVVLLSFDYHPKTVGAVKEILAAVRRRPGVPAYKAGGWLPQVRRWYIDPCCWSAVGRRLIEAGYTIVGHVDVTEAEEARVRAAEAESEKLLARIDRVLASPPAGNFREALTLLERYRKQVLERGAAVMTPEARRILSLLERRAVG